MVLHQGRACGSGFTRKPAEQGEQPPLPASSRSTLGNQLKRNGDPMSLAVPSALIFGESEVKISLCK